jgi:hypothetical protein
MGDGVWAESGRIGQNRAESGQTGRKTETRRECLVRLSARLPVCPSPSARLPVCPSARLPDFSAGCPTLRFGLCSGPFSEHEMLTGTQMVRLGRQDLDVWLGEPDDFVLAVLRDIYSEEFDVKRWLNTPHDGLGGNPAIDLLSAGRVAEVESVLVEHWNAR